MSMAQAHFQTDSLLAFMVGFGEGVNDLKCKIANMKLTAHVDTATHYFTKSIGIVMDDYKAGTILIPDVHKVGAFLKSCKEPTTMMRHIGNTLTLMNGNQEFSTPTHDHIISHATVDRALVAIGSAMQDGWKRIGNADLDCSGNLTMEQLRGLSSMTKVVGKDAPVSIKVADGNMIITAGSKRGARMNREIEVDVSRNTSEECETVFGSHLPKLVDIIPSGPVIFYMGNKSALVLKHGEVAATLILKHQEGVDA